MPNTLHAMIEDTDRLKKAIARGDIDVNEKGESIITPLHEAIVMGKKEAVKILIESGADVNLATTTLNESPLHVAVASMDIETINLLIDKGADVNVKDCHGDTPLHYAVKIEHDNFGANIAKILLDANADSNLKNNHKHKPLDIALVLRRMKIVTLLESYRIKKA